MSLPSPKKNSDNLDHGTFLLGFRLPSPQPNGSGDLGGEVTWDAPEDRMAGGIRTARLVG